MRSVIFALALVLAACAAPPTATRTTTTLSAADAATSLLAGDHLTMTRIAPIGDNPNGEDPVIRVTLTHADGRSMSFDESNHAPMHVMAQAPGGPLAQVMGLFGEERPTLYGARANEHSGAPFLCGPEGPIGVGYYEGPDGIVQIVGLKQQFGFDTLPSGAYAALPYSPDQVCARLRFRRS